MKACFQRGLWQVIQTPPRITWQRVRGSGICLLAPVPHCLRFVRKGFNGPTISGSAFTQVELDARSCVGETESHSWPSRGSTKTLHRSVHTPMTEPYDSNQRGSRWMWCWAPVAHYSVFGPTRKKTDTQTTKPTDQPINKQKAYIIFHGIFH